MGSFPDATSLSSCPPPRMVPKGLESFVSIVQAIGGGIFINMQMFILSYA